MKKQTKEQLMLKKLNDSYAELLAFLIEVKAYFYLQVEKKEFISTKEITDTHHVSRQTVYRLINKKVIVPIFKNRSYYFDKHDVSAFFTSYRNPSS